MDISKFVTYDLPVKYKGLEIHPARVRDYDNFNIASLCLTFDKNSIPDPEIISMTNLEFIFYTSLDESKNFTKIPYLYCFNLLLSLVIKDEDKEIVDISDRYGFDEKGKPFFKLGGEIYNSSDFEEIRLIIAEQNSVELIDENISKEVRDSLEKARAYKRKLAGTKNSATTEDYIVSLSISTGWGLEYIYDMTIRKFLKAIERMDNLIHYKIYLSASMSGMVEFKDKSFIKHWLSNLEQDKYKDVSMDLDALKGAISLESAKK